MSIYGLGDVTDNTAKIAREVLDYLAREVTPLPPHPDTGVPVVWGKVDDPGNTEHYSGRALDFMVTADTDLGDVIAAYVWAHRDRLGLIHVIWRQRILSTRVAPGVWRDMDDRGTPTANHMDHPHCLFDGRDPGTPPGQLPRLEEQDDPPPRPAPTPKGLNVRLIDLRDVRPYVTGPGVKPLQRLLDVADDGYAGPRTRDALGQAQTRAHLTRDYIFGPKTAEALLAGKGVR